jgi:heme/copper-type cytochrome/quinol oxidase subunit 3
MPVLDVERSRPAPPAPPERRPAPGRGGWPPAPPAPRDDDRDPPPGAAEPGLSNARLGMLVLLAGETVFFGGLVAAFLQLRMAAPVWPPPGQPRLPVGLTAVNTLVLLASSLALRRAGTAVRADDRAGLVRWLGWTGGLGLAFLAVQGVEWTRLVSYGLAVSSGAYGATFYTLIGIHGAHVLGAVLWLAAVWVGAWRGRYTPEAHVPVTTCTMYWHYVVALWPILYVLVYLA